MCSDTSRGNCAVLANHDKVFMDCLGLVLHSSVLFSTDSSSFQEMRESRANEAYCLTLQGYKTDKREDKALGHSSMPD